MKYAPEQFFLRAADEMKALFAETPEAVRTRSKLPRSATFEIQFGKLHYPVFHPPEHFTREGYLRRLLAEGLHRRYTLRARAENQDFIVEGIDDPGRLPTYQPAAAETGPPRSPRATTAIRPSPRRSKLSSTVCAPNWPPSSRPASSATF